LILSRLILKVKKSLERVVKIEKIVCLTDAEVVLNWIQRDNRVYKQFVQNRVKEVRLNTDKNDWYHVPGIENAADLPSRGCFPSVLENEETKKRWLEGPHWLLQKEENWPVRQNVKERWDDPEIKDAKEKGMTSLTATNESCSAMKTCIIPERYYTFTKLIRVTAWCLRFSRNCKGNIHRGELDAKEIATAKQKWIKELQETLSQETNFKKRS